MKKFILLLLTFYCLKSLKAQTVDSIFTTDHLYYYGLDFSNARFTGFEDETSPEDVKESLFKAWNQVILEQPDKFNLRRVFRKKVVYKDITAVEKKNKAVDPSKMFVDKKVEHLLTPEAIEQMVQSYDDTIHKEGIGLVFIIEYFSKPGHKGSLYVTFFDNASRKVLLSKHMLKAPSGFGLRNYWISTVYKTLEEIEDSEYNRWKSQASKNK